MSTKAVVKEDAMLLQKELINRNYHEVATARARPGARFPPRSCPGT